MRLILYETILEGVDSNSREQLREMVNKQMKEESICANFLLIKK